MAGRDKYSSKTEYYLDYYKEKLEFASTKVTMQLKKAVERKREQDREWKIFGGMLIGSVVLFVIAIIFGMSGVMILALPAGIFIVVGGIVFTYAMPICVYKIVRGVVLKIINDDENSLGDWIVQKYRIPRVTSEIVACQTFLNRYKLKLQQIEGWRYELHAGFLELTQQEIEDRLGEINYDPKIAVATDMNPKFKRLVRNISLIITVLLFVIAVICVIDLYLDVVEVLTEAFRNI